MKRKNKRLPRRPSEGVPSRRSLRRPNLLKRLLRRTYETPFRVAWSIKGRSLFGSSGAKPTLVPLNRNIRALQDRLKRVKPPHAEQVLSQLRQTLPREHRVCVQRNERREVLFASGFGGRRRLRRPKRNLDSQIRCR